MTFNSELSTVTCIEIDVGESAADVKSAEEVGTAEREASAGIRHLMCGCCDLFLILT